MHRHKYGKWEPVFFNGIPWYQYRVCAVCNKRKVQYL